MNSYTHSFTLKVEERHTKLIRLGKPRVTQNKSGAITRIYLPVTHNKLGLFKEISGADRYTLQEKLNELMLAWDKKYQAHIAKGDREAGKELAAELVTEAEQKLGELERLLNQTLQVDDTVDWDSLTSDEEYEFRPFPKAEPKSSNAPKKPELILPRYFPPQISFFQRLLGQASKLIADERGRYQAKCEKVRSEHEEHLKEYEQKLLEIASAHEANLQAWKLEGEAWAQQEETEALRVSKERDQHNRSIQDLKEQWSIGSPAAVVEHASLVLDASEYPDWFQGSYRLEFDEDDRLMRVEFMLPTPSVVDVPKTARFIASTGEIKTTSISKAEQKRLYDSLCYQVALRTVHELFEADTPNNIDSVLFNGVVRHTDPATGKEEDLTIMSAVFERGKFLEVNLAAVDPKACFKSFKGVSAASLSGLAAIAPVIQFDTADRRFIEGREVAAGVDEGMNVAAMSWDDFEHLVREIFEKEFASRGGEVKVTQSSSDGGVDAVAFDPDPITGGKIVIQAKRYTKTVGVSAVRDLYGTVMNEGASKGILVTTADYGPDAYKFAADKPITLLNGANLLHLLSKHGVNAQIDLKAARQELGYANAKLS